MGGPKPTPKVAPITPMPTVSDPVVEEAARKRRIIESNTYGRQGTILTGQSGVEDKTVKKTLLGS